MLILRARTAGPSASLLDANRTTRDDAPSHPPPVLLRPRVEYLEPRAKGRAVRRAKVGAVDGRRRPLGDGRREGRGEVRQVGKRRVDPWPDGRAVRCDAMRQPPLVNVSVRASARREERERGKKGMYSAPTPDAPKSTGRAAVAWRTCCSLRTAVRSLGAVAAAGPGPADELLAGEGTDGSAGWGRRRSVSVWCAGECERVRWDGTMFGRVDGSDASTWAERRLRLELAGQADRDGLAAGQSFGSAKRGSQGKQAEARQDSRGHALERRSEGAG